MKPELSQPMDPGAPMRRKVIPSGMFRFSAVELLVTLALLFFLSPFVEDLPNGNLIEAVLVTMVMGSAVLAVGGRRRTLLISLLLVAPAVAGRWANHLWPCRTFTVIYLLSAIVFFAFVASQLLRFILRAPRVDMNVLCAGIAGFLILGLLWIPAYVAVAKLNPAAFNLSAGAMEGFNAFYFSFVTLTTVGYGDIAPASNVARMLAVTEAICGMFYMAVMISRLVSLYSAAKPSEGEAADKGGIEQH